MNERKFEYIDREKAIKELTDWKWGLDETYVMQAIGCVPAEDVAPVVHGKWVDDGKPLPFCSECQHRWGKHNYCPHCGARMDGDPNA